MFVFLPKIDSQYIYILLQTEWLLKNFKSILKETKITNYAADAQLPYIIIYVAMEIRWHAHKTECTR
jgi:hypothetical protein